MAKDFNDLFREVTPLRLKLASEVDYKKLRFTRNDILGFFDEKLFHVWLKYNEQLPFEEVKAIAIASLYNLRGKVYKIYSREVSLGDTPVPNVEDEIITPDYLDEAKPYLSPGQYFILTLLVNPPIYVVRFMTPGKRIPSRVLLDYLGFPYNKQNVKKLNTIRRGIFDTLRSGVNQPIYS